MLTDDRRSPQLFFFTHDLILKMPRRWQNQANHDAAVLIDANVLPRGDTPGFFTLPVTIGKELSVLSGSAICFVECGCDREQGIMNDLMSEAIVSIRGGAC
jgi:hypothetical protein